MYLESVVQFALDKPGLDHLLGQCDGQLVVFAEHQPFGDLAGPVLQKIKIKDDLNKC